MINTKLFLQVTALAAIPVAVLAGDSCEIPDLPKPPFYPARNVTLPESYLDVVLSWPIAGTPELNSPFGPRQLGSQSARYDWHRGLDLKLPMNTPIYAPADAVVVHAGSHPGYSDTIVQLRHNSEEPYMYTLYLHLAGVEVSAGDSVTEGTLIAQSGQGSATYPHLHWEVRFDCLNQQCCENPYSYLGYTNNLPAAPVLEAFGSSAALGNMVLVSATMPKTEIDFQMMELSWGGDTITADLNAYNHLTPPGDAAQLDDPLFFYEEENRSVVFLPKRFNSTYDSADYELLFFNLDDAVFSGTATVGDGGGLTAQTALNPNIPPLSMQLLSGSLVVPPGGSVTSKFLITNNDAVSHQLDMTGISAQSLDLTIDPDSTSLGAGDSIIVDVDATMDSDWPEDVGDLILLRVEVDGGAYTDLLGSSFVDTMENATASEWWTLD